MQLTCNCSKHFSVENVFRSQLPHHQTQQNKRHHSHLILTEVCHDVHVEPDLQLETSNQLDGATANRQDGARLGISSKGDWGGRFEKNYFDVRILNPHALLTKQVYQTRIRHMNRQRKRLMNNVYEEQAKETTHEQCVREVEHSSFTPLIFSSIEAWGMKH